MATDAQLERTARKPKRRWWQYSISSLLLVMLVWAVGLRLSVVTLSPTICYFGTVCKGKITLNGNPVAGASIFFRNEPGGQMVVTTTHSDGSYSITAWHGVNQVRVVKHSKGGTHEIPEKYGETSRLKAEVSTDASKNVFDFDLET